MPEIHLKRQKDVAAFLGVATSTLKQWRNDGCPGPTKAGWPLGAIVRWKFERLQAMAAGAKAPDDGGPSLQKIKTAQAAQKLQHDKWKFEMARGDYIHVDVVGDLMERSVNELNAQIEQLPDRVLSVLPRNMPTKQKDRVLKTIAKSIDDARHSMADMVEEWERGDFDGDDGGESETDAS